MTRARIAAVTLTCGVVAMPVGAFLHWDAGVALLIAGALLVLVGLVLGWDG